MSEFLRDDEPQSARYALPDEELQQRTQQFLHDHPPESNNDLLCYRVADELMRNVARTVECQVFEKSFDNTPEIMARIYGPYEEASDFFLLVDQQKQQPAGALRIIKNSPAGLMTLNTLPESVSTLSPDELAAAHGIDDMDKCWDIGTVAVLRDYERRDGGVLLYRAMSLAAYKAGIEHYISIIDTRVLKGMTKYLRIPFVPLAGTEPFAYEGSKTSQAVYGYLPDFYNVMSQGSRSLAGNALGVLVYAEKDGDIKI